MFMNSLRQWTEVYIDKEVRLEPREYRDVLFFNCKLHPHPKAILINCCLDRSELVGNGLGAIGMHVGLDCQHFGGVTLSEDAFDQFLLLLVRTRGNTTKRQKIIDLIVGKARAKELLRQIGSR